MTWLALVVDALAVYRITRLVVADDITQRARDWLIVTKNGDLREWLETLLGCRWCVGVWVGAGVSAARMAAPGPWTPIAYAAAIATAAPLLARLEPPEPPEE